MSEQWEYKTETFFFVDNMSIAVWLNKHGEDGWEAFHSKGPYKAMEWGHSEFLFKRQVTVLEQLKRNPNPPPFERMPTIAPARPRKRKDG